MNFYQEILSRMTPTSDKCRVLHGTYTLKKYTSSPRYSNISVLYNIKHFQCTNTVILWGLENSSSSISYLQNTFSVCLVLSALVRTERITWDLKYWQYSKIPLLVCRPTGFDFKCHNIWITIYEVIVFLPNKEVLVAARGELKLFLTGYVFLPQKQLILQGFFFFFPIFVKWDPLLRIFLTKVGPMSKNFWWKSNPFGWHIPVCLGVLVWQLSQGNGLPLWI